MNSSATLWVGLVCGVSLTVGACSTTPVQQTRTAEGLILTKRLPSIDKIREAEPDSSWQTPAISVTAPAPTEHPGQVSGQSHAGNLPEDNDQTAPMLGLFSSSLRGDRAVDSSASDSSASDSSLHDHSGSAPGESLLSPIKQAAIAPTTREWEPAPQGSGYFMDDGPGKVQPVGLENTPDAEPQVEPLARGALKPYKVMGRSFVPQTSLEEPYKAKGHASWYGKKFHGNRTAMGEIYDMHEMTAAHPTLPLPSYVKVTNLKNGKSVIVRVNDRGPFIKGRIIDLSYAAAVKLDFVQQGSARVLVEKFTPQMIADLQKDNVKRDLAQNEEPSPQQ